MSKTRLGLAALILCVIIFPNYSFSEEAGLRAPSDQKQTGRVIGLIIIKGGGPLPGGRILFYDTSTGPPPLTDQFNRLPDFSGQIDSNGRFTVEIPAGQYFIRAVKKNSEVETGLQKQDYVFISLDDKGDPKKYTVKSGAILDVGALSGAVPYKVVVQNYKTAIEGIITDMEGRPVKGAIVFAFVDDIVNKKPLFASNRTGDDGRYILKVPGGTYYLKARNKLGGGPPEPGQIVGMFGERTPVGVTVKEGDVKKGIDIKVITFRGRGPAPGMGPKNP